MALYLLDADALIDYCNRYQPTVLLLERLLQERNKLAVCDVSVAEAFSGLDATEMERSEAFVRTCDFLTVGVDIAQQAGRWRYQYARRGVALSTTDVLVAATAYANNATLVSGNVRHFPMQELSILPLPR